MRGQTVWLWVGQVNLRRAPTWRQQIWYSNRIYCDQVVPSPRNTPGVQRILQRHWHLGLWLPHWRNDQREASLPRHFNSESAGACFNVDGSTHSLWHWVIENKLWQISFGCRFSHKKSQQERILYGHWPSVLGLDFSLPWIQSCEEDHNIGNHQASVLKLVLR